MKASLKVRKSQAHQGWQDLTLIVCVIILAHGKLVCLYYSGSRIAFTQWYQNVDMILM